MARRLREIFSATAAKAIYPKKDVLPLLVAKKSGIWTNCLTHGSLTSKLKVVMKALSVPY